MEFEEIAANQDMAGLLELQVPTTQGAYLQFGAQLLLPQAMLLPADVVHIVCGTDNLSYLSEEILAK